MLLLSITDSSGRHRLPVAWLLAHREGPVTDVELRTFPLNSPSASAILSNYARFSEQRIALVARCLWVLGSCAGAPDEAMAFVPWNDELRLQLSEGPTMAEAELRESLLVQVFGGRLRIAWQDDDHRRVIDAPTRHSYRSGGELLEHATRLASWGVDEVPPSPTALHERVGIRVQGGERFVREQDIPHYARIELKRRSARFKATEGGTLPESEWLEFLQG